MDVKLEQIKVITPGVNKCLKISQNGKVIMYMKDSYYNLPHYNYNVEEVPVAEAEVFMKKTSSNIKKLFNKIKFNRK